MNIFQRAKGLWTDFGQSFTTWQNLGVSKRSQHGLLKEYQGIVYACISLISSDMSQYKPIVSLKEDRDGVRIPETRHSFYDLLENPGQGRSQSEIFEATSSYLDLTGDAFWYTPLGETTGQPKEIIIMRPDAVTVVLNESESEIVGYVFNGKNGNKVPLETEEVTHFKFFNPLSPHRGLGTVQAGLLYIESEQNLASFQNNFLKNQASPSGVLSLKGKIGKETFNKIKKQWKETYAGTKNAGKTLIIRQADSTFTKIGLTLSELDVSNLSQSSKGDVLEMFKVPEALLGRSTSTGLGGGRSIIESLEYSYTKRVVNPRMIKFDNTLANKLKIWYSAPEVKIEHVSPITQDKEHQLKEDNELVDKVLTKNEIRVRRGLKPQEGGDKLYVPFNYMPIDEAPQPDDSEKKIKITLKKKVSKQSLDTYFTAVNKIQDKGRVKYRKLLNTFIKQQEKVVIDLLKTTTGEKNYKAKILDETLFELVSSRESLVANLFPTISKLIEDGADVGFLFFGEPDADFILEQSTRDAVFDSTDRLMRSFSEETASKLQKQLAAGLANGEDIDQLTKRVESIYSEATGYRSKRIARDQAHKAVNRGIAESFLQSGYTKMRWKEFAPSCQFCLALDGTVVTIGKPFVTRGASIEGADGGEFLADFDDVSYGDLHPNCDCKLLPEK